MNNGIKAGLARWSNLATLDADIACELAGLMRLSPDSEEIRDRFYRALSFGTGGLRGVLGAGTNRMNVHVVRQATQGVAQWLLESGGRKRVAIAYDTRNKSGLFAREAARVFAGNGITAYIYPRHMPTPALSFAVRHLGCGAGICITASHNIRSFWIMPEKSAVRSPRRKPCLSFTNTKKEWRTSYPPLRSIILNIWKRRGWS